METDLRDKQRKNYSLVRSIRDFTMEKLKIDLIISLNETWGKEFCYFFGGICLLYGGFRLYRGIKKEY